MVIIGKDLNGNELGKGICQRKDGRYEYRKVIDGKRLCYYSKDFNEIDEIRNDVDDIHKDKISTRKRNNIISEIEDKNIDDNNGIVYFISDGNYCKIGYAKNLETRLHSLQTISPNKLELLFAIETNDYKSIEKQIHNLFSKYLIRGEWYDILFLFKKKVMIMNMSTKRKSAVSKEEIAGKILWSVEDIAVMTGFGEKKVREILKNPNSTFTIRKGNKFYAHRDLFQNYLEKCAKLGLTI